MPEYLGTFIFYAPEDNFWRTWHIWGYADENGEVIAIHIGISKLLECASGKITRSDCGNELRKLAMKIADQGMAETIAKESNVIELNDWRKK